MTSPQELLETTVHFARSTSDAILHALKSGGKANRMLRAQCCAGALAGCPPKFFADIFAFHIVSYFMDARYVRPEIELTLEILHEHVPDETNPDLAMIFTMLAQGQLNPQIMAIIDNLIDHLRKTDVQAILTTFSSDINRNRYENPMHHFRLAFLAAYNPEIAPRSHQEGN
jgi:hypothetical protein